MTDEGLIASTMHSFRAPSKSVMLLFSNNTNNLYAQKGLNDGKLKKRTLKQVVSKLLLIR